MEVKLETFYDMKTEHGSMPICEINIPCFESTNQVKSIVHEYTLKE